MYRVGIVGCGGISGVHAQVLSALDGVELAACADIRPERARRMAEKYACRAHVSLEAMLDAEKLDAVHLCTPHHLHPDMALTAAQRGVAVFTEKPPAIDAPGWEKVKQAGQLVPLGICFQNRMNENVRMAQQLLRDGTYGALRGMRAFVTWHRDADYYRAADWKGKWHTEGGGALINQAVHTLDLLVRFLGEPDEVEATLRNHHLRGVIEVEDTAEIWMRRQGIPAILYATTGHCCDAPVLLELQLDEAVLRLEDDRLEVRHKGGVERIPCAAAERIGRTCWGAGHRQCISDFYQAMRMGEAFANDCASCEATMRTLLRIYDGAH